MDFPFIKEAITQLFSKPSCNMYPFVPVEAAPKYRGRIVYHADRCIACGMCERVCAGGAISRTIEKLPDDQGEKITLSFDLGSCTFCSHCADFCSRDAIELTQDYHMIGVKDDDLAKMCEMGVSKINLGTSLRMAFGNTLRKTVNEMTEEFDRLKFFPASMKAVSEKAKEKMTIVH